MNPYEILGVPYNATDSQVKNVYRRLVKQYHPDRNKGEDAHQRITEINQAYEILSDPIKRAQYDNPFQILVATVQEPEDPIEVYKREFKRKRWEKERAEKMRKEKVRQKTHYVMRLITIPILLFAITLFVDDFLPKSTIDEAADFGYQEGDYKKQSPQRNAISFMKTPHFLFQVQPDLHLNYPYDEIKKPKLKITATPIFHIPRGVSVTVKNRFYQFEIPNTIHSASYPIRFMLLLSCLFTVGYRKYTDSSYSMSFFPIFLFAFVLMILIS